MNLGRRHAAPSKGDNECQSSVAHGGLRRCRRAVEVTGWTMMNRTMRNRKANQPPADWQLPPGVNRGLWDYLHDPAVARGYDAGLAGTPLFALDPRFVEEHRPRPGRLLDLRCGTGRLLIPVAHPG